MERPYKFFELVIESSLACQAKVATLYKVGDHKSRGYLSTIRIIVVGTKM